MKAVHFDGKTGKEIEAHVAQRQACIVGFCSWRRLAQVFRDAREIRDGEEVLSFQVDDDGIKFRVEVK